MAPTQSARFFLYLLSAAGYVAILFFIPRTQTTALLSVWSALFAGYFLLLWLTRDLTHTATLIGWGIAFRLLAWFAFPSLSDDCYRFFWDGQLWLHGVNPFQFTPAELMAQGNPESLGLSEALFRKLNSPEYYTVYPPVMQAIFFIGAWASPHSLPGAVWVMKGFVFFSEIITLALIVRLLRRMNLPAARIGWYALNPLVVLEFAGNLHFEALMLTGMLLAWHALWQNQAAKAGLGWAWGICVKLLPAMFSLLWIRRLAIRQLATMGLVSAVAVVVSFALMVNGDTLAHLLESVRLYYRHFEFNAPVWYLIREFSGIPYSGEFVAAAGRWLAVVSLAAILVYLVLEKRPGLDNLPMAVVNVYLLYFLFSQTVHPWYIAPLVCWTTFTGDRFGLAWSGLVIFTYLTYRVFPYAEPMWVVWTEYAVVLLFFGWDRYFSKQSGRETIRYR
jgi:hypothetical protein